MITGAARLKTVTAAVTLQTILARARRPAAIPRNVWGTAARTRWAIWALLRRAARQDTRSGRSRKCRSCLGACWRSRLTDRTIVWPITGAERTHVDLRGLELTLDQPDAEHFSHHRRPDLHVGRDDDCVRLSAQPDAGHAAVRSDVPDRCGLHARDGPRPGHRPRRAHAAIRVSARRR